MSKAMVRFVTVDIEVGCVSVAVFGDDDVGGRGTVQVSIGSGCMSAYLYLDEFQAAKLSQELFESVQAIAASRTVSPAPTLEEVSA